MYAKLLSIKLIPNLSFFIRLLVLTLPFVRIVLLPVVDAKIQLTELVFLVLAPVALWRYGTSIWPRDRWLQAGLVIYLMANIVSAIHSSEVPALLEAVGRIYLVLLALIIGRWVSEAPKLRAEQLLQYFMYGTAALAVFTYIGYLLALTGELNSLVQVYGNYPYLGTVLRAKGFTAGGGMLIIVLLLPTLYAWQGWRTGKLSGWWFVLLFPLALLTFSKEVVLLGAGLLLVDPWVRRTVFGRGQSSGATTLGEIRYRGRWMQSVLLGAVAMVFWLGTHYIIQEHRPFAETELAGTNYTAGNVIWVGGDYQIIETSYTELKKAGVSVAAQYPWLGVGPGQFGRALPAEKAAGRYPASLPDYDPHSTWLGAWSETGVFGFVGLLLLVISFGRIAQQQIPKDPMSAETSDETLLVIIVFLLLILIMSVSKDVMNFRFLWLALGMLLGLSAKGQVEQVVG